MGLRGTGAGLGRLGQALLRRPWACVASSVAVGRALIPNKRAMRRPMLAGLAKRGTACANAQSFLPCIQARPAGPSPTEQATVP